MRALSLATVLIAGAVLLVGCEVDRPTDPAVEVFSAAQPHASQETNHGGVVLDWAWGNDVMWDWVGPISPLKGVPAHPTPRVALYFMAPVFEGADLKAEFGDPDLENPTHLEIGVGEHNHVLAVPKGNRGSFTAIVDEIAVIPGPDAIPFGEDANVAIRCVRVPVPMDVGCPGGEGWLPHLYAADLGQCADGDLTPLTSVARVERAAAAGLAHLQRIADMDPRINPIPVAVRPTTKRGEGRVMNEAPECITPTS